MLGINVWLTQLVLQFTPKVLNGSEVRALCRAAKSHVDLDLHCQGLPQTAATELEDDYHLLYPEHNFH